MKLAQGVEKVKKMRRKRKYYFKMDVPEFYDIVVLYVEESN